MASLKTRIENLATAIATKCKSLNTFINGNAADLSGLNTAAKTNLVAALNELEAEINVLQGASVGATVNDASSSSASQVYSIDKVLALIAQCKADILGGAAAAQDTLLELKAYVDSGEAGDLTALANRLRIDVGNQGLTSQQQQNVQDNASVYSRAEIGNPDTDFAAVFAAGLL
jgi:hypothetical protein